MPKIRTFEDLFVNELKDLYNAEQQLTRALPRMAKAASTPQLRKALEDHLEVTREQVRRLEQVFEEIGAPAKGKTCQAMKGLIEEGQELVKEGLESEVLDAGIIGAAQRVEHYEIAGYGTARTMAETLGHRKAVKLLEQTLKEEKAADEKLTRIAESIVNVRAAEVGASSEEEE
jgi:ferritin-like metal-binding protein YciE